MGLPSVVGFCRAETMACVGIVTDAAAGTPAVTCRSEEGMPVPATLYPITLPASRAVMLPSPEARQRAWVASVPLLPLKVDLVVGEPYEQHRVAVHLDLREPGKARRVFDRLTAPVSPALSEVLRGVEQRDWTGQTRLRCLDVYPAEDESVWRLQAVFPAADATATPRLVALGANAAPLDARAVVMEDHVVPSGFDQGLKERFVTFSVTLPATVDRIAFVASIGTGVTTEGFFCVTPAFAARVRSGCRERMLDAGDDPAYEHWLDTHRANPSDLSRQRKAEEALGEAAPSFGVVLVAAGAKDSEVLRARKSVEAQGYGRYETVMARGGASGLSQSLHDAVGSVSGDYLVFLDVRCELEEETLWRLAEEIVRDPQTDFLYTDADHVRDGHYAAPEFKTFPNLGKLRSFNYVGDMMCASRALVERVGLPDDDVGAAWAYDLALRCLEQATRPIHVSRVLLHVHEGIVTEGDEAGRRALQRHLERCHTRASVDGGPLPGTYRVRYEVPDPAPLVSIVIPSKDHRDLLRTCVSSVLEKSTYPSLEVIIVENNSEEPETFETYTELERRDGRVRVVTWEPTGKMEGGFNYSAIVNFGASRARGDVIVFLNNDTQVIEPSWLEEMLGCLSRPEVAVVGAKLLFEDGLVQHAGMIANPNGDNAHVNQNLWKDAPGYGLSAALPSDMNMVTGACQMVRRTVIDELGGYDENLAVGFNDAEFCLRVRSAGYAVAFTPYALLYHREFSSRGREAYDPRMRARLLAEKAYVMGRYPSFYAEGDDTVNGNLDRFSNYFRLRW